MKTEEMYKKKMKSNKVQVSSNWKDLLFVQQNTFEEICESF